MTPDPSPCSPPARAGYRIRPPETWRAVRAEYLSGVPAEEVATRFGVGESALRARARRQGWRRADQPAPMLADEAEAPPPASTDELLDMAWRRVTQAVAAGRSAEALRWTRVHDTLARADAALEEREAREAERAEERERTAEIVRKRRGFHIEMDDITANARAIQAQAEAVLATQLATEKVQDVQSKNISPDVNADDAHPLSRAERRRRQKLASKSGRDP